METASTQFSSSFRISVVNVICFQELEEGGGEAVEKQLSETLHEDQGQVLFAERLVEDETDDHVQIEHNRGNGCYNKLSTNSLKFQKTTFMLRLETLTPKTLATRRKRNVS